MAYNFKKNKKNNGVDDMTLISKLSEDEVMQNLKKRFANDSIYTYIGDVLISVNPFRFIPGLTTPEMIESYKGKFVYENPPHVFALAEKTYRNMVSDRENQCVLITGESGAGKTEASKLIMQYIAAVSGNGDGVERVKRVILESNPLLEAFGNAKTLRNNNSSRFGKLFQIHFDTKGDPCGGKVTNYLLEKSRVIYQISGERNFHIFYQMCAGLTPEEKKIYATNDPRDFHYLNQSNTYTVDGMDDAEEFRATRKAMTEIGMSKQEQDNVLKLIAGILWLGNISFAETSNGQSQIADQATLQYASYLLGVNELALQQALLFRVITTGIGRRGSTYNVPQTPEQAGIIRDALAKTLYDRMFDWLVQRVNQAFVNTEKNPLMIGVLDIYGFEIFDKNGFEQLCINYTNEKLQQIFIDQTLKAEQDEYKQEGIQWKPIKFFNNKIVCDLIDENRPPGLLGVLDDTCHTTHAMDSSKADEKFVQRLSDTISNPHLFIRGDEFTIRHYAGDVSYSVSGFTEKNKDVLYNTLVDCMQSSNDPWIRAFFPEKLSDDSKKRPTTAGFKIKKSCNDLVATLKTCVPSYIRCIKPNETKQPKDFEAARVLHQVKYLGLLENIRVRRAGFAYRHFFEKFLERFCILSKKTWPMGSWNGDAKGGCEAILNDMGIEAGEFQFGSTKVFLRHPETLFGLEEAKERKYHDSASVIARTWRKYKLRRYYLELRASATNLLENSKERRRLSINRVYLGDYINYAQNAQVQEIMKSTRDEGGIVFADILYKPIRKRKGLSTIIVPDQAFLLVTSAAIYIIERVKVKKQMLTQLTARITWSKLQAIEMSALCDNYLVIKRAGETDEDIFGECNNKTEFLSIVNDQYKKATERDVTRNFGNELVYMGDKKKKKTITFIKDPTNKLKLAKLSGSGTKWKIEIAEGMPPTSQPKTIQYKAAPKSQATGTGAAAATRTPGLPMAFQSSPAQEQNYRSESFMAPQPAIHSPPQQNQFASYVQPKQGSTAAAPKLAPRAKAPPPLPKRDTRPKCKAMYDYDASADDELTLRVDDIVIIVKKDPSGWWEGELDGKIGLFPGNYCVDI